MRANVDGQEQTKQTSYTVIPRDFSNVVPRFDVREADNDHLPDRPTRMGDLGDIHLSRVEFDRTTVTFDLDGPNREIAYLTGIPISYIGTIHVNKTALSRGSAFWRIQLVTAPAFDAGVRCTRDRVEPFIPYVLSHEGLDRNERSHAGLFERKLDDLAAPAIEAITGKDYDEILTRARDALQAVQEAAVQESRLADTKYPVQYVCNFNFTCPR